MTEKEEMASELMQFLEESIADIAIREKLDPMDLMLNGFPVSICQEAVLRLGARISAMRVAGLIGDATLVATPIGEKMKIDIVVVSPGHIERVKTTMSVGIYAGEEQEEK